MDESQVGSAGRKAGVRPARLRGFHRAVKRGEEWALRIWGLRGNPLAYLMALSYRSVDFAAELQRPNPFMDLIKKNERWMGSTFPVPFTFGTKLSVRKRAHYRGEKKC